VAGAGEAETLASAAAPLSGTAAAEMTTAVSARGVCAAAGSRKGCESEPPATSVAAVATVLLVLVGLVVVDAGVGGTAGEVPTPATTQVRQRRRGAPSCDIDSLTVSQLRRSDKIRRTLALYPMPGSGAQPGLGEHSLHTT
jgi:hypothetical protein